jgi:hypothetical protein
MHWILQIVPTVLVSLGIVAGCSEESTTPAQSGGNAAIIEPLQLHVGFPPGSVADTIAIDAVDRLPLRTADLISPDGTTTAASYVNSQDAPRLATGQWAAGNAWYGAVGGSNALAALTLANAPTVTAVQSQAQLLAIVSRAEVAVPDPAAYRHDWRHYRLRLTFGVSPSTAETREIAAPPPPPAPQ